MADSTIGVLKAVLQADTTAFTQAMQNASGDTKKLATALQNDLEPRQRAVNAAIKDFLGGTEIRKALEYADAVEKIGGVSALSADDQKKVSAAVQDAIGHYEKLGLEAPQALQKIQAQTQSVGSVTQTLQDKLSNLSGDIKASAIGYATGLISVTALQDGFQKLSEFVQSCIESFEQQEVADKKVEASLKSVGAYTPQLAKEYRDLAGEMQELTVNGNDVEESIIGLLTSLGVTQSQMRQTVMAVNDLSTGMGIDLNSAAELVAKAMAGNVGALTRYGIVVKSSSDAAENADRVLKALQERFGGQAQAEIETTTGKVKQLANAWDDFKKNIGASAFLAVGPTLKPIIAGVQDLTTAVQIYQAATIGAFTGGGEKPKPQDIFLPSPSSGAEAQAFTDRIKSAYTELGKLTTGERATIDAGLKLGVSMEELVKALQSQNASFRLSEDAQKLYSGWLAKVEAQQKAQADAQEKATKQILDDLAKFVAALREFQNKIGTVDQGIKNLQSAAERAGPSLTNLIDAIPGQRQFEAKIGTAEQGIKNLQAISVNFVSEFKDSAPKAAEAWSKSLSDLASGFQQMAQIADGELSTVIRDLGTATSAASTFASSVQTIGKGGFANALIGSVGIFSAVGTVASIVEAFRTPAWMTAMRDVGQRWGVSISQGLAQQIADSQSAVAKQLTGNSVTAMLASPKNLQQHYGVNTTQAGEALNLSSVINEAGGLNAGNLATFQSGVEDLFSLIQLGGDTGSKAFAELQTVAGQFADQATKAGGLWSDQFQAIIAQAKAAGLQIDAISQAINGELAKASSATGKVTGGQFSGAFSQYDTLQGQLQTAQSSGDDAGAANATEQLAALRTQVQGSQADFDRLSRITLATFNSYIAQGHSAVEATAAVGDSIDTLKKAQSEFGLSTDEAFDKLSRWRDLTQNNQGLIDSVSGLNDLMSALANTGSLDAQTFKDLGDQGVSAFGQLTKAGFTQQEAETQLAPLLQTVLDLHQKSGLAIDDETQKLIDQAQKDGVLKGQQISQTQILVDGIGALITAVGGDLPESFKRFAQAGSDATSDVSKKIDGVTDKGKKIFPDDGSPQWQAWKQEAEKSTKDVQGYLDGLKAPDLEGTIRYHTEGLPGGDQSSPESGSGGSGSGSSDQTGPGIGAGTPPGYPGTNPEGFAGGTRGLMSFDPAGEWVKLHGHEEVLTAAQSMGVASMVADALSGGRGTSTIQVIMDGRIAAQSVIPHIPGQLVRMGLA